MLTKTIYFFLISITIFLASSFTPKFKPTFAIKTVVIDAGHGGKDPGCHGSTYKEKDIALAVALKLGKYIEDNMKDVRVVYTRKTDIFVELQERAMIANRAKADLFICVHCNSACVHDKKSKKDICRDQVHGAETYVMGIKNEKGKLDVAKRENASILLEDDYVKKYDGFDPNSDESYIIMSMFNDTYLNQSLDFASKLQKQYATKAGRDDHEVKRASLWVLWRTYMPAVLTEIGYLTNLSEERFLGSEKGQDYMAASIFRGFRQYKDELEGTVRKYDDAIENQEPYKMTKEDSMDIENSKKKVIEEKKDSLVAQKVSETPEEDKPEVITEQKKPEQPAPIVEKKKVAVDKVNIVVEEKKTIPVEEKKPIVVEEKKPIVVEEKKVPVEMYKMDTGKTIAPVVHKVEAKKLPAVEEKKPVVEKKEPVIEKKPIVKEKKEPIKVEKKEPVAEKKPELKEEKKTESAPSSAVIYKVQIMVSEKKIPLTSDKLKGVEKVGEYMDNGIYKYTAGEFATKKDAVILQTEMRKNGYKDAFVIATQDGKRIPFK